MMETSTAEQANNIFRSARSILYYALSVNNERVIDFLQSGFFIFLYTIIEKKYIRKRKRKKSFEILFIR